MKSFKEYKYDYGSPESVKLMKKVTPGQKEAINWAKAGTKAQIMHPITRVAKKVDKKDVKKYVDAGWLHMAQKKNRITKEAVYGNQAQRLSSPLQKMRQDKEKADRDRHGKLHMMKGRPKKEAMSPAEKAAHDKAIAAFKAKGGKVKKLKPGYAQGYHGKDDPGSGMRGMLDKGDSKAFGTRKKIKSMGESMRKVAAVQGQMSKINDRLRKNPKHPGAGKDRTDLLDLQRKMVALRKSRNESINEAINVNDAHTDAQNHSNGSMSVKKVQGKPSLIMKSYHSEKDGHAFAKKHGYKASNYVKTHAGSRMHIESVQLDELSPATMQRAADKRLSNMKAADKKITSLNKVLDKDRYSNQMHHQLSPEKRKSTQTALDKATQDYHNNYIGTNKDLGDGGRRAALYKSRGITPQAKGSRKVTGEEFTMKQYRKNEDENRHSENALELAKKFGTKKEIETVKGIHDRHMKRGHITEPDRSTRDKIARKYYPRLAK